MSGRPPISIGIQPQIALYSVILGTVCAVAAYTEKYRRNEENIDGQLKERYYADMRDQQAKIPQMTQAIRGQDYGRVDQTMNKLVWGGYANMQAGGGGGGSTKAGAMNDDEDETDSNESRRSQPQRTGSSASSTLEALAQDDDTDSNETRRLQSRTGSASSLAMEALAKDDDAIDESKLSKRERKRRRKLRRQAARQQEELQQRLDQERHKVMVQSVTAGAAMGAIAVAASFLLSSSRK